MLSTFAYEPQVCTLMFPALYFQTVFEHLSSVFGFVLGVSCFLFCVGVAVFSSSMYCLIVYAAL